MYRQKKNKRTTNPNGSKGLSTTQFAADGPLSANDAFFELEAAEVIDVIRDGDHPEFHRWEDIGKIKVRMVNSEYNRSEDRLSWAKPADPNLRGYPLKHEIVVVGQYLGEWYYMERLNMLSSVNQNIRPWISIDLEAYQQQNKSSNYRDVSVGHTGSSSNLTVKVGDVFEPNYDVKPLKHYEGDIILEGRFGNSIRFTSNQDDNTGLPIVKIRNGQFPEARNKDKLELIEEDINTDFSSIYMTQDWTVDLEPATQSSGIHYYSVDSPPDEFDKAQIISNTDRQVHNSRSLEYIVFSKKGIYMMTEGMFTYDAVKDVKSKTFANNITDADKNIKEVAGENSETLAGADIIHDAKNNILDSATQCIKQTASNQKFQSSGTNHLQAAQNFLQGPTVIQGPLTVLGTVTVVGSTASAQFIGPMPTPGPVAPSAPSPAPC